MEIKFVDGVNIVVDDDKVMNWSQSNDGKCIIIRVNNDTGINKLVIDIKSQIITTELEYGRLNNERRKKEKR